MEALSPEQDAEGGRLGRWMHHLVAALLHRGSAEDEERAFFHLEKVVGALSGHGAASFPDDECRWFASIAYNKGTSKFK
jgi:hypothetical protein